MASYQRACCLLSQARSSLRILIAGDAGDKLASEIIKQETLIITNIGLALLWLSALVTLYTGWDYMRAGVRHMID